MKRLLSGFLLTVLTAGVLCAAVSAESGPRSLSAGFYAIGTADNVTVEPRTAENIKVDPTTAAVGRETFEYYEGAERLSVTYTGPAEENDRFLVLLVTGDGLPTASDAICYIDQTATGTGGVTFDVYPMLPATGTDLTLYITGSREDFTTIEIPLSYAVDGTYTEYTEAPYVLGDVDGDGFVTATDAMNALQMVVGLGGDWTEPQRLAANVDGGTDITAADAMKILQRVVGLITDF